MEKRTGYIRLVPSPTTANVKPLQALERLLEYAEDEANQQRRKKVAALIAAARTKLYDQAF